MAYAVQIDIERAIGADKVAQLADDDNDGVADAGVIAEALDWADRMVNPYVAGKYAVPFTPSTPPEIADRAAELAAYWLYRRRQNRDETVQKMFSDAVEWLKDLQAGKVNVSADPATGLVGVGVGQAKVSAKEPTITDEKLERY